MSKITAYKFTDRELDLIRELLTEKIESMQERMSMYIETIRQSTEEEAEMTRLDAKELEKEMDEYKKLYLEFY